jgi:membrane protein YqaA with SNARE-associated domain
MNAQHVLLGCVVLITLAILGAYHLWFTPQKLAVRQRLNNADEASVEALDTRLKPLHELFDKAYKGAPDFAKDTVSLEGKWNVLVGLLDGSSHREYLRECFGRRMLSSDDLRDAMEAALRGYAADLDAIEAEMLVKLRVDLEKLGDAPPALASDEAFAREYRQMHDRVAVEMQKDLGVFVASTVASTAITAAATEAAIAAATRLGVVTGTSAVATLGVGLVLGYIIDYLIGEALKLLGHDPEKKIESQAQLALSKTRDALLQQGSWFQSAGSFRKQMEEMHEARSKVRRETVRRIMKGGAR